MSISRQIVLVVASTPTIIVVHFAKVCIVSFIEAHIQKVAKMTVFTARPAHLYYKSRLSDSETADITYATANELKQSLYKSQTTSFFCLTVQFFSFQKDIKIKNNHFNVSTRMIQLPATAAIEYVAACCRTRTRTKTKTKTKTITKTRTKIRTRTRTRTKTRTKTKTGTKTKTVRGAYAHSPQVQCVYAP